MGVWEVLVEIISAIFLIFAILFPGIIPTWINGIFGSGRRSSVFNTITTLFIFAALSYCILAVIYNWIGKEFPLPILGTDFQISSPETESQTQTQTSESKSESGGVIESFNLIESLDDIAWATLISLGILCISLVIYRKQLIVKGLHFIRLSDHYGEKDVWTNQQTKAIREKCFVRITDTTKRLIFTGWVTEFSEYDNFRELLLENVEVHDFDYFLVSKSDSTYLSLPNDNIWIDYFTEERRIQSASSTSEQKFVGYHTSKTERNV